MERRRTPEYEPASLEAFSSTFLNRRDAYPLQQPDGTYVAVKRPLTHQLLAGHLIGGITLGAYALDEQSRAKWVCFDGDTEEQWAQLCFLAISLEDQRIPVYRELSRRGGHLWLHFQTPIPGVHVRRFARQLLLEHEINPEPPDKKAFEIYPRQVQLVRDGLGSLVRLPLGLHRKSGKIYPFVDRDNIPLAPTPRELLPILATPDRVPLSFIMSVMGRAPQVEIPKPTPAFSVKSVAELAGRPPSERIKAAISTVDFVRQYVELDAQGKGYCPFHDDEHKSFNVVESGDYWNCFAGCGGGDLIHFWSKWRAEHGQDGSFTETIKDLIQILGL
jgi:hypothetical protein